MGSGGQFKTHISTEWVLDREIERRNKALQEQQNRMDRLEKRLEELSEVAKRAEVFIFNEQPAWNGPFSQHDLDVLSGRIEHKRAVEREIAEEQDDAERE